MSRFDDYHRTVVGYHGTGLSAALRIVTRVEGFRWSRRDFDWLGHGIYFWEYGPDQALEFATIRQRQYRRKKDKTPEDERRATEPLAVVASMIRLGHCFDLLDPKNVRYLLETFENYREVVDRLKSPMPRNSRKYRKLDCAVFEYAYDVADDSGQKVSIDTTRGVYVPSSGDRRVWEGSWISQNTHIQLCVRNPANILGTWLHDPRELEIDDVRKTLQDAIVSYGPDDPEGPQAPQDHADVPED